ncbi:FAD-dependent thymidylate synthase [Peptoniphilus sp. KCTC 25270]|uniref:FAD-dependent thymidylate synthase n=1 Tax=Peptoniphilus sp. KCTC 25270 TaxID=2897414 RepID=UPI001E4EFDB7|nr:FAD-dependent thymidylate synthase [Peptoniphilus sp. KCTC 25270]MCD1147607.1 FAD-dependent thymidylate synthase [Peptoniphilus sp. KCTC 25270]
MKVKLLSSTPNGEELIAKSAKLCYSAVGVEEIEEKLTEDSVESFLTMLTSISHASPMEHVSMTFAVEGVSRVLTHQLVRHRLASYSQQSQRYVPLDDFQYIIPPSIEAIPEAKALYEKTMEADRQAYIALVDALMEGHVKEGIERGLSKEEAEKKAQKMSIEDARYVFPNACETKIVVTMNIRTLLHFFSIRTCQRAQWEIREMATEMLRIAKETYPTLFAKSGPSCVRGACPEGKMSCGRAEEMRKFFLEEL